MHLHLTMHLHLIMLTVHSHLTMHWLDIADDALACQVDHAFMPHFNHALKVAHAFATKLTMSLSLIILSALEFHTMHGA